MAVLLMKLRLVPEDELADIESLLEAQGIEYFLTTAGNWGLSMPALWVVDEARLEDARSHLQDYADQRQARARELFDALKEAGRQRTVLDIVRENPFRYVLYIVLIAALIYVSIIPFINLIRP